MRHAGDTSGDGTNMFMKEAIMRIQDISPSWQYRSCLPNSITQFSVTFGFSLYKWFMGNHSLRSLSNHCNRVSSTPCLMLPWTNLWPFIYVWLAVFWPTLTFCMFRLCFLLAQRLHLSLQVMLMEGFPDANTRYRSDRSVTEAKAWSCEDSRQHMEKDFYMASKVFWKIMWHLSAG